MKKLIVATLLVALLLYLLLPIFLGDTLSSEYDTKQSAVENGAVERGWVPLILPDSAYDIAEKHNLDTNDIYGTFSYKERDEAGFVKNLTVTGDANHTLAWGDFLFRVDRQKNRVKFRNKTH
jgi:hypothetical protein